MADFEVRNVILCDDGRREISGKEILVGVYNDVLIVGGFPALVERLFVRVVIRADPEFVGDFGFGVWDDKGNAIAELAGGLSAVPDRNRVFGFTLRALSFQSEGTYKVRFRLGDTQKDVLDFDVRVPADATETERLALIN
jgi:hypothetical protein